jgi:hypothetical protein
LAVFFFAAFFAFFAFLAMMPSINLKMGSTKVPAENRLAQHEVYTTIVK